MKTFHIGLLLTLFLQLTACGGQLVGWPTPDDTAPTVTSTSPRDEATSVERDTVITADFSEPMNPTLITSSTFRVTDGTTPIAGEVSYDGLTATFEPDDDLDADVTYTVVISDSVADEAGNTLGNNYEWSFTTEPGDTTPPEVASTSPSNDAIGVDTATEVTATFNEQMDPQTFTQTSFVVRDGVTSVPGEITFDGLRATFRPEADLTDNTEYTAEISTDVTDIAGNALAEEYVWSFTTGPVAETNPPRVTSTFPADRATGVSLNTEIAVVFSEAMDPLTITDSTITVEQGGASVAGTVTYVGRTGLFKPTNPLSANTTYSARVTTGAQDLAGNSLIANFDWNFRTGAVTDTTRPRVLSTVPSDTATDVFLNADVTAHFSEAMNPTTLTATSVTLENGAMNVTGTVVLTGNTVTFNPDAILLPDTVYTATISNAATDMAGNALAEDYVWSFTTGSLVDNEPPTVILTAPADLANGVALNASVNARFSEPMRPLTITSATFTLALPNASEVVGTVSYDVATRIATFRPAGDLLPDTTYTATVTTGVADLSGNRMVMDFVWTFSTGAVVTTGLQPVDLGSLTSFVAVAGAGLTNSNTSGVTILNGDVGLHPDASCLGDGNPCTITNPVINGTLYANDAAGVAALAKTDLTAAYVDATSRPPGTTVNDISGMVLAPGVYSSGSTMSIAVGGTVTLDGQGDANSVFIFQIGSSLTVNDNARVLLINGAAAKNVFWAVDESSTLGANVDFSGSVLAGSSNSVGTDSVVLGRLLCTSGAITLLSNVITLPSP